MGKNKTKAAIKKPFMCLVMIVKNEAHIIEETLECMLKYIDYYVISDTGSTDGTQEKIKNYMDSKGIKGEIYQDKWKNHFGYNRSLAFEHAKGKSEYMWVIDADDVIRGNLILPKRLDADSYLLTYGSGFTYQRVQIFKNFDKYDWWYVGVRHEFATTNKPNFSKVRIPGDYHIDSRRLGDRSKVDPKIKYKNDAIAFEEELTLVGVKDDPLAKFRSMKDRTMFYLGQSYYDCGEFENAIDRYSKRAAMGGWIEEVFYSLYKIAQAKSILKRPWEEVEIAYMNAFKALPIRVEPLHEIAKHYRLAGDFQKAYQFAKMGAGLKFPEQLSLFIYKSMYDYEMLDELAISSYYVGEYTESLAACKKLLNCKTLPPHYKQRVLRNMKFSEDKLKEINKKTLCLYLGHSIVDLDKFVQGARDIYNIVVISRRLSPYKWDYENVVVIDDTLLEDKITFDYLLVIDSLNYFYKEHLISAKFTTYYQLDDAFKFILKNGFFIRCYNQEVLEKCVKKMNHIVVSDSKIRGDLNRIYGIKPENVGVFDIGKDDDYFLLFSEEKEYSVNVKHTSDVNGFQFIDPKFVKELLKPSMKGYFIKLFEEMDNFLNLPESMYYLARAQLSVNNLEIGEVTLEECDKVLSEDNPLKAEVEMTRADISNKRGDYQTSYDISNRLLRDNQVKERRRWDLENIRDKNIDHLKENYVKFPAGIINRLKNNRKDTKDVKIAFSITTCKRFDLFDKTIKSFLNCCLDVDMIDYWLCVDDNSSENDRNAMEKLYPFFNYVWKGEEEKGHYKSMNIIHKFISDNPQIDYLIHMEDDWQFVEKREFVKECIKILDADGHLGQALFNRNYAEIEPYKRRIPGGIIKTTSDGYRYVEHEHYKSGTPEYAAFTKRHQGHGTCGYWPHYSLRPSMLRCSMLRDIGEYYNTPHFEMKYAEEYVEKGYRSAFIDTFSCIHIGKKTWEVNGKNSYTLNKTSQFYMDESELSIYVTTYQEDHDRWKKFKEASRDILPSYKRKKVRNIEALSDYEKKIFKGNRFNYRRDMINIIMGHVDIFRESKSDHNLILMDDVVYDAKFKDGFKYLVDRMKAQDLDYEILLLGISNGNTEDFSIKKYSNKINYYCSGGYFISKKGMAKILESLDKGVLKTGDELFNNINIDYLSPNIIRFQKEFGFPNIPLLEGYKFFSHLDSFSNDLEYYPNKDISELKKIADSDPRIAGFNSLGYIKHTINKEEDLIHLVRSNKLTDGLYVKENIQ